MKGLRFADTQYSCFDAWYRLHMCCSALLCGRFADSQIVFSGFETFKYGKCCPGSLSFANIHEFCFQTAKRSDMDCLEVLIVKEGIFKSRNVQIIALPLCKCVDILKFTSNGFTVRNDEICAVLCSNEVDLQMPRKCVFRPRNDKKCAVYS